MSFASPGVGICLGLAPAADETAVWVVEAKDVQVASGLSVVGALVEARTLAVHGKKEVSVPENFQRNEIPRWHTWRH